MKKIMALAVASVLLLAGCAPRADRADQPARGGSQPVVAPPAAPAAAPTKPDTSSVDNDLRSVDSLLGGVDDDLSAAAKAPDDAD